MIQTEIIIKLFNPEITVSVRLLRIKGKCNRKSTYDSSSNFTLETYIYNQPVARGIEIDIYCPEQKMYSYQAQNTFFISHNNSGCCQERILPSDVYFSLRQLDLSPGVDIYIYAPWIFLYCQMDSVGK